MNHELITAATTAPAALLATTGLWARTISRAAEQAAPPTGKFVLVEGQRLHYDDRGSGPTLVLIHGLAGNSRNFLFALSDQLTDHYRVIAVDRPGSGHSAPLSGPFSLHSQANVLAAFIERVVGGSATVLGHSLGGAVALRMAIDNAEIVDRLALICPAVAPIEKVPLAFRRLAIPTRTLRALVAYTVGPLVARRAAAEGAKEIFRPEAVPADFETAGGAVLATRSSNIVSIASELAGATEELRELDDLLGAITVPVRALGAHGDNVLSNELHLQWLQRGVPHAELTWLEGGHMLPATQARIVSDWIRNS